MSGSRTKLLREEAMIYVIEYGIKNAVNFWRNYKKAYIRERW